MPRMNNNLPPKTQEKMDAINLRQNDDYWHGELYVMQPLSGKEAEGSDDFITGFNFQNHLNTTIREGVSSQITIPIKTATKLSTNNGTIRYRIISGTRTPLSTQTKGKNTIDWMQNNRNVKLELETALPDKDVMYFFYFEDPKLNQVEIVEGETAKKVSARTYYKTNEEPKVDHLSKSQEIVGQYIELTGALEVFLQNEETGASLIINYTTQPIKPKNAKYAVIEIESMCLGNSIEITSNGNPINILPIDKGNAESLGITKDNFISDDWFIDLADPRSSLDGNSKKPLWRSTMSGEIHNKFRIWDEIYTSYGKEGHFDWIGTKRSNNNATANDDGYLEINQTQEWGWSEVIPNRNYFIAGPTGLSPEWANDVKDIFNFNIEVEGVKSWYNDFSFFENLYSEKNRSTDVGNPKWKTTNSFFTFDVQKCQVIGVPQGSSGNLLLEEGLIVSNPENIKNPNFDDNYYYQKTRDAITGSSNINGTTFTGWVNTLESTPKDDAIYNWDNSAENRKYLVWTPKLNYIQRYKKLMETGGQFSSDNNFNIRIGKLQITSKRQPFPTGDGSKDIHYDSNIWYDAAYAAKQGWPTNNKIVLDLGDEKSIDKILLNIWAGIKYKISFYDGNFKPAIGIDENGADQILAPNVISAGNVDITNDPLKSSVEIIYGISTRFIL